MMSIQKYLAHGNFIIKICSWVCGGLGYPQTTCLVQSCANPARIAPKVDHLNPETHTGRAEAHQFSFPAAD
jgi:hypothetical protein